MTNLERIKDMDSEVLSRTIENLFELQEPKYIDWKKWLESEDENISYKGQPAMFEHADGKIDDCLILYTRTICGDNYATIVIDNDVYSVPMEMVMI